MLIFVFKTHSTAILTSSSVFFWPVSMISLLCLINAVSIFLLLLLLLQLLVLVLVALLNPSRHVCWVIVLHGPNTSSSSSSFTSLGLSPSCVCPALSLQGNSRLKDLGKFHAELRSHLLSASGRRCNPQRHHRGCKCSSSSCANILL